MFLKFKFPVMVCVAVMMSVMLSGAESITDTNKWYPTNRAPLKRTKYVMLPVTTVRPAGWLNTQLQLYAHGLTGHLFEANPGSQDDIATFIRNSRWRNDTYTGDRWEAGPYYVNGLIPLAYLLNDTRLIAECQSWINTMIAHRNDWFSNVSGDDMWASSIAWQGLRSWFEARGELPSDTANFYALTRNYLNLINGGAWGSNTWAWTRAGENYLALQWWHRRTRATNVPAIAQAVKSRTCDWTPIFNNMLSGGTSGNDLRNPQGWYMQGHVVNIAMAIKFGAAYYPFASSTAADSQAGVNAYGKMCRYHGQIPGNFSGDESLAGLKAWHGTETCGIVESMYSLENMIEMFGRVEWADGLEYLAYNHLTKAMTADGWNRQYHAQVNQVLVSSIARSWQSSNVDANLYGNYNTLFRCCTVNMHQGWPKFVINSWMATHDNGLAAVVYAPTTITARVGSGTTAATVTINETTEYPFKNTVTFTIGSISASTAFPLVVRVPLWGQGTSITAAGATITGSGTPTNLNAGQWVTITKTWNAGDQVTVTLPFTVRAEKWFQNGTYSGTTETFSNPAMVICRGPLVFAKRITSTYTKLLQYTNGMGACRWQLVSDGRWNYALCVDTTNADSIARCFQVVEQSINSRFPWVERNEMCYDSASNTHSAYSGDVPVILRAKAKRVTAWGMSNNSAGDPPASPMTSLGAVTMEDIELIPIGSARLRTAAFPWEFNTFKIVGTLQSSPQQRKPCLVIHKDMIHGVTFAVGKAVDHRIDIVTMSGRTIRSFGGDKAAKYVLSRTSVAPGVYLVRARVGSALQTSRIAIE
jgi:hypothetical protein